MADTLSKDFNSFLKEGLNEQQRAAVVQKNGACLIVAGAGSGKTRVITSRIAHLVINHDVDPSTIVALTFTNKAAGEMRTRLVQTFQSHHRPPFIGTFHSYCLLLLRNNPNLLPFHNFSILDADDQHDLIKKICKKYAMSKQASPAQICHSISQYKNKAAANVADQNEWFTPQIREVYLEYESEKARSHCLDFDDLIVQVLHFLQTNTAFKEQFQSKVRHVLIDEYQDTSHVQHQLLLNMALNKKKKLVLDSLCAVGDDDQSIYSWRGATVANMLRFQSDFAPVTVIKIEQNFRSVQPILEAANTVISNNKLRNEKNLWSTRKATNRILHLACQSGDQEAALIAALIKNRQPHQRLNSIAILYRTHFQSRPIEESLIHQAVPYRIVGGIRFYERKEIKDLIAYLRLIANPYDKISLLRIINTPTRGLGQKFEDELIQALATNPLFDFVQALHWMRDNQAAGKKDSIDQFLALFKDLGAHLSPSYLLETILARTNYLTFLTQTYDTQETQAKSENIQELLQAITIFEQKYTSQREDGQTVVAGSSMLETFLYEVSLLQEKVDEKSGDNFVSLMTLHAAKGLEFDTVILTGLDEGLLPNNKSLTTNEELEEERRLMYVGMTRAKNHLVITNAFSRFTFGYVVDHAPSRFLDEIPKNLMHTINIDRNSFMQAPLFFERWFSDKGVTPPAPKIPHPAPATKTAAKKQLSVKPASTTKAAAPHAWNKNQTVLHQTFGVGIVVSVEKAPEDDFYVTAIFKAGKKKVLSRFLQKT